MVCKSMSSWWQHHKKMTLLDIGGIVVEIETRKNEFRKTVLFHQGNYRPIQSVITN